MKKYFLLVFGIFIFMIMPKTVFAQSYSGNAGAARSAVMNTSNTYYYTAWTSLNTNSLNIIPIPYSGGDYYLMGSEYSFAVTMTGDTYFSGHVTIPVAANTIYNYTLTNGLSDTDMRFGIDQNFGVYNVNATINSANWYCNVYEHLGVAHTYCYYDIYFHFSLPEALSGAYNLNVAVLNLASNRSAYYYSGYDSNGCAIEFPMSASNSGYPDMRAYMTMSSSGGQSGSPDNTEEILNGVSQASAEISQTIQESYENLVKSQEVCTTINKDDVIINGFLQHNGTIYDNSNYGITDYINITDSNITTLTTRSGYGHICFYNSSKTLISCLSYDNLSTGSVTIPSNSIFARFTVHKNDNAPTFSICKNGNQAIFDSFNDSNVDNSSSIASGLLEDAQITDKGLTGLVATVLDFINDIFDSTCSPLSFELPFVDTTLTLPCMSTIYTTYFPDLFNLYQLITTGFIAYRVIINLFDKVKKVQDPEYDKVEVLQL